MPKISVEKFGSFEVAAGKRLVNALEDAGIQILHRCGGNARCTTCRVQFHVANHSKLPLLKRKNGLNAARAATACRVSAL